MTHRHYDEFAEIEPEFRNRIDRMVWAAVATIDTKGRPSTRILHPIWDGRTGWIGTHRNSNKRLHLERVGDRRGEDRHGHRGRQHPGHKEIRAGVGHAHGHQHHRSDHHGEGQPVAALERPPDTGAEQDVSRPEATRH